jgi:hypothetical protein
LTSNDQSPRVGIGRREKEFPLVASLKVGTFNLHNLFSRFNFEADLATATTSAVETTTTFTFDNPAGYKLRTYKGRLVKDKSEAERKLIAEPIKRMDLDVLAVQEVEDIDTLRQFVREDLNGLYTHSVLIEGNDPRLIDVGLARSVQSVGRPLGSTSPTRSTRPSRFFRDLLQVQVLKPDRRDVLATVFVTHLKSHYVPFDVADPEAEAERANELRKRQCEAAAAIILAEMRPNSSYLFVGDMNDPPDSQFMAPLTASPKLNLISGLTDAKETRPGPGNRRRRHQHGQNGSSQQARQRSTRSWIRSGSARR